VWTCHIVGLALNITQKKRFCAAELISVADTFLSGRRTGFQNNAHEVNSLIMEKDFI
jgi:hypothetical protein